MENQGDGSWTEALFGRSLDIFKERVWFIFQDRKINKAFFKCNLFLPKTIRRDELIW